MTSISTQISRFGAATTGRASDAAIQAGRQIRWARRAAYHRIALHDHPRVVCNSFHKTGTHLLVGVVSGVPGLRHYGRSAYWHYLGRAAVRPHRRGSLTEIQKPLSACLPGEIIRGHIAFHPEISQLFAAIGLKHVLIYRDPRDTIVSLFHWWKSGRDRSTTWPRLHFNALKSDEDRFAFLVEGWTAETRPADVPQGLEFPDIGTRFREFMPWLDDPGCLAVGFEDVTAGSTPIYTNIAKYLLPDAEASVVARLTERMNQGRDPARSKTFRKGRSGEWRRYLPKNSVKLVKQYAGDVLISLGYEKDMDW